MSEDGAGETDVSAQHLYNVVHLYNVYSAGNKTYSIPFYSQRDGSIFFDLLQGQAGI